MNPARRAHWPEVLASLEAERLAGVLLHRIVERGALESRQPPDFLFTSGRPGRYHPAGVPCVYFSADAATAGAEFDRYWEGRPTQRLLYFGRATAPVLDLTGAATRAELGLGEEELFRPWRFAPAPVATQQLGAAIAAQRRFAGIRFPADAARARGFAGSNLVFFRSAVVAPGRLEILDDAGQLLQAWPAALPGDPPPPPQSANGGN